MIGWARQVRTLGGTGGLQKEVLDGRREALVDVELVSVRECPTSASWTWRAAKGSRERKSTSRPRSGQPLERGPHSFREGRPYVVDLAESRTVSVGEAARVAQAATTSPAERRLRAAARRLMIGGFGQSLPACNENPKTIARRLLAPPPPPDGAASANCAAGRRPAVSRGTSFGSRAVVSLPVRSRAHARHASAVEPLQGSGHKGEPGNAASSDHPAKHGPSRDGPDPGAPWGHGGLPGGRHDLAKDPRPRLPSPPKVCTMYDT